MIPKTIAHYEILAPIGEGGMGVVYRALDTRLGRPVAVKLLSPEGAIDGERRKRFVQEARAASALNHPHIITIYDIGQAEGLDFIAMEYVPGPSLAQAIAERRLSVGEALQDGVEIADALAAAHAAGILHRDLKPANIMLGTTGDRRSIKVLDFGLAKLTESADFRPIDERASTASAGAADRLQTEDGTILGTAAYRSPEAGRGQTCGRAVGCLLVWRGALRDAHRPSCVQRRDKDLDAGGHPHERAGTAEPPDSWAPARSGETAAPLPQEKPGATLAVDGGSQGGAPRPAGRIRFATYGRTFDAGARPPADTRRGNRCRTGAGRARFRWLVASDRCSP